MSNDLLLSNEDETCRFCSAVGTSWHAPNDLWNKVMEEGGTICPLCFVAKARLQGVEEADQWWQWAPFPHDMVQLSEYVRERNEAERLQELVETLQDDKEGERQQLKLMDEIDAQRAKYKALDADFQAMRFAERTKLEAEINRWACLLDRATKECDPLEAGEEWHKAAMGALNG